MVPYHNYILDPCYSFSMFQLCKYAKQSFKPSWRFVHATPEFQALKLSLSMLPMQS